MKFRTLTVAFAAAVLVSAASGSACAARASPEVIAAAVADPARPPADTVLDATRKPSELLALIGLRTGDTIVDVFPGPYWDRLFSRVVGPTGRVIAFQSTEMAKAEDEKLPVNGTTPIDGYSNVVAYSGPINAFSTASPVDVVWMRQNYHDLYDPFMGPADVPAFNKAVFASLKHGGRYVIIDHSAPDGSGLADVNTTHRIDAAVVKTDMAAAGFVFAGQSDALRNASDTRDKLVFDKAIRGKTDQFVYVFRKP